MKADTQIVLAIVIFFTGWAFGCVDANQPFLPSQQIDWVVLVGAFTTLGLVYAAFSGLRTWRHQLTVKRDYDLAVRVINAVEKCDSMLAEMRYPSSLLSDDDDPTYVIEPERPGGLPEFQRTQRKYVTRQRRLAKVAEERSAVMVEALLVWKDEELDQMVKQLVAKELEVIKEAGKLVEAKHTNPQNDPERLNYDILYSSLDDADHDPYGDDYSAIVLRIGEWLGSKLRME